MTYNITKVRAALECAKSAAKFCVLPGLDREADEALTALAELERAAKEPVAWMWNDELGIPHASAGSKKPVWLESSASAEYIKQANLRPLYAVPPAPVAEIREPTPEECERIYWAMRRCGYDPKDEASRGLAMFNAVRAVMWPKEGL